MPGDSQPGKPGRLRAACNYCHAAKVRCSGEKTGCSRCRTVGQECIYLESRVGKTRERRRWRSIGGKDPTAPALPDNNTNITTTPTPTTSNNNSSSSSSSSNHPGSMADEDANEYIPSIGDQSTVPPLSTDLSEVSPGNSSLEILNPEVWTVSQSIPDPVILDMAPEFPGMDLLKDFFINDLSLPCSDYHDHHNHNSNSNSNSNDDGHLRSTWRDPESNKHMYPAHRHDSGIDIRDASPLSSTQQPSWKINNSNNNTTATSNSTNRSSNIPSFSNDSTSGLSRKNSSRHPVPSTMLSRPGRLPPKCKVIIMICAEILELLEGKVREGLSAIDEVLRVNRDVAHRISKLINRTDYTSSVSCSVMVIAAAHHVVSLFEVACSELYNWGPEREPRPGPPSYGASSNDLLSQGGVLADDRRRRATTTILPAASCTPGIGFGSFLLDPEEQAALRARIISTELRRSLEIIQALSVPFNSHCQRLDSSLVVLDGWLQELERRMQSLISSVENG